ncbi:MAG: hypothetical protein P8L74_00300 [Gammaproteobacteria bacterium]|nr:hypothetical protein [Gammaproteobacteria bacterium]
MKDFINSDIKDNLQKIRDYRDQYPELLKAHHFTYDLVDEGDGTQNYMVMGKNPGESGSWKICDGPTEETSEYDFFIENGENKNRSAVKWNKAARNYLGDLGNIVFTNFFFWSSKDSHQAFKNRFEYTFKQNKHFDFCIKMNQSLIKHYKPEIIVAPGIPLADYIPERYGFGSCKDEVSYQDDRGSTQRLIKLYFYNEIPFIFTKHWSARLNKEEKNKIKQYLENYLVS